MHKHHGRSLRHISHPTMSVGLLLHLVHRVRACTEDGVLNLHAQIRGGDSNDFPDNFPEAQLCMCIWLLLLVQILQSQ